MEFRCRVIPDPRFPIWAGINCWCGSELSAKCVLQWRNVANLTDRFEGLAKRRDV